MIDVDCPEAYYWYDPEPYYYDVYYYEPVYPVYYYAPVSKPVYYVPGFDYGYDYVIDYGYDYYYDYGYDYGYYYDDIIIFAKSRFEKEDVDLIEKGLLFAGHHYSKVSSNPRIEVHGLLDPQVEAEQIVCDLVSQTLEETEATEQMVDEFFLEQ